jgi:hypothetical protein
MIEYWAGSQLAAHVAHLEGDLDRAAQELRDGCEHLEAMGETAFLSTNAGALAVVESRRGDLGEAERWLRVAERTAAPGDIASHVWIELARGMLRAPDGDDAAAPHLRESLRLMDETDSPTWRAEVRLYVANTLGPSLRDEAIASAREARDLGEAKGAIIYMNQAQALLEELGTSG